MFQDLSSILLGADTTRIVFPNIQDPWDFNSQSGKTTWEH
jgi:hypothetical protein